jgi:hypothetical protein
VGQVCGQLHFLHAATDAWNLPAGTTIGRYLVNYANGQQQEIPLVKDQALADWWGPADEPGKGMVIVWTGNNAKSQRMNCGIRLFKTTWLNPLPGVAVHSINLEALHNTAAPFLIAITAE